jgi:hypothetical protein
VDLEVLVVLEALVDLEVLAMTKITPMCFLRAMNNILLILSEINVLVLQDVVRE